MALALNARASLAGFLFIERSFAHALFTRLGGFVAQRFLRQLFLFTLLFFPLLALLFVLSRDRKAFPGWNGGGVAGDVPDDALLQRFHHYVFVSLLRHLPIGKLGKGARHLGLMRHPGYALPTAEFAPGLVDFQAR